MSARRPSRSAAVTGAVPPDGSAPGGLAGVEAGGDAWPGGGSVVVHPARDSDATAAMIAARGENERMREGVPFEVDFGGAARTERCAVSPGLQVQLGVARLRFPVWVSPGPARPSGVIL